MPTIHTAAVTRARKRKLAADIEYTEAKVQILRGDYLDRDLLKIALQGLTDSILQIIESSKLSIGEKDEARQNLSQIPVIIERIRHDQSRSLARAALNDGDGDKEAKTGNGQAPRPTPSET